MSPDSTARGHALDRVFEELAVISRRTNARSRALAGPLSFVEHSLLQYIGTNPDCRAIDIATAFHLSRSTISRQLATLEDLGLIVLAPSPSDSGPGPGRGHSLALTELGRDRLDAASARQREAMLDRLAEWSDEQVAAFADLLSRFNASAP